MKMIATGLPKAPARGFIIMLLDAEARARPEKIEGWEG
jgi:hypothetical protein